MFLLSEGGDTFVVRPGDEHEEVRVNSLDELTLATPAIAGGSLYVRTESKLYRIANP